MAINRLGKSRDAKQDNKIDRNVTGQLTNEKTGALGLVLEHKKP